MAKKPLINQRLIEVYGTLANNLIRRRGTMTQEELAKKAGVSRSTISAVEKGLGCSLENLIKLTDALGIKPADLFITDEERKEVSYQTILVLEKIKESLTVK